MSDFAVGYVTSRRLASCATRTNGDVKIPRIVSHPLEHGFSARKQTEFRHRRLSDAHQTRLRQPLAERGLITREVVCEKPRAHGAAKPWPRQHVLDHKRNAVKCARRSNLRNVPVHLDDGTEQRIQRFDASQACLEQLACRDFTASDQPGLVNAVHLRKWIYHPRTSVSGTCRGTPTSAMPASLLRRAASRYSCCRRAAR